MEPNFGPLILWTSLLFYGAAIALSIRARSSDNVVMKKLSFFMETGGFISLTAGLCLFVYAFLNTDMDLHNVWLLTSKDLDPLYKFSAVWSGMDGSIFVWGYIILAVLFIRDLSRFRTLAKTMATPSCGDSKLKYGSGNEKRSDPDPTVSMDHARTIALVVGFLFLIMIVMNDPFAKTHSFEELAPDGSMITVDPSLNPDGAGLKPELENPWMMIHPPVVFISYAGIVLMFAASVSSLFTGIRYPLKSIISWTRLSWLLLTIGIGSGALWAYTVVKWGGYWSWDPKETSAFIIWISLSVFLFAQYKAEDNRFFGQVEPFIGISTFAFMLFGTFITRSGLWETVPIEMQEWTSFCFLGMMFLVLVLGSILLALAKKRSETESGKEISEENEKEPGNVLDKTLIVTCGFLALMLFGMLLRTMNESYDISYFEAMVLPGLYALLLLTGVHLLKGHFRGRTITGLAIGAIIFGIIIGIVLGSSPGGSYGENFLLSIDKTFFLGLFLSMVGFFSIGTIVSAWKAFELSNLRSSLVTIGSRIIILGIAVILVGHSVGSTYTKTATDAIHVERTVNISGEEISVVEWEQEVNGPHVEFVFDITVVDENGHGSDGRLVWEYYADTDNVLPTPFIVRGFSQDTYITIDDLDPDDNGTMDYVLVNVRHIPFISLVWIGFSLMIIGMLMCIVIESTYYGKERRKVGGSIEVRK